MNWTLAVPVPDPRTHVGRSRELLPPSPRATAGLAERWCGDGCAMGVLLFILHIRYLRFRHGRNDTEEVSISSTYTAFLSVR